MLGKFDQIQLLWAFLSKNTQMVLGKLLILTILVLIVFFPVQYMKWGGIITIALIEEWQREIMENFQPIIDAFVRAITTC